MKTYVQYLNESLDSPEARNRSGRLLTQEQAMCNEIYEKAGGFPAVMFTDVVGSSQMWSDDPMTMKENIDKHFNLINGIAKKYDGFVVKTIGDAFMIYFEESRNTLENAIECGLTILSAESLPLRVGICEGPMQEKSYVLQDATLRDFFSNVVNVASRMESRVADPEGIAFSSTIDIPQELVEKFSAVSLVDKPNLKGANISQIYKISS